MMVTPAKIGRPIRPVSDDEGMTTFNVRITADLRRKIEASANKSGRSLSREAEIRLQQSFDTERALDYLVNRVEEAERRLAELVPNKEG
jgi:TraY domain